MAFVNWSYKYEKLPLIREGAIEVTSCRPGPQYEAALKVGKILMESGEVCPFDVIVDAYKFRIVRSEIIGPWVKLIEVPKQNK
jgi:hypothetical protein